MADLDLNDDLSKFEAKETSHKVPVGWAILFWGLVLWMPYYLWTNSPALGGWSQAQDADGGGAAFGSNLVATLAFTILPSLAALGLWVMFATKKKKV
ncbi:MAG: hypothetical protein QM704_24495 [Anaeromyxobacteraceae bacterium]